MNNLSGRSAGSGAAKGVLLTITAVTMGLFVLLTAFDSPNATNTENGDDNPTTETMEPEGTNDDGTNGTVDPEGVDNSGENETTDNVEETTVTEPLIETLTTRPPEVVKTATVNGTSVPRLAGATADILVSKGYVAKPKNANNSPVQTSAVYYIPDYADDAKAIADAISAPADIIVPAPDDILERIAESGDISDFHIFVILGTDSKIPIIP